MVGVRFETRRFDNRALGMTLIVDKDEIELAIDAGKKRYSIIVCREDCLIFRLYRLGMVSAVMSGTSDGRMMKVDRSETDTVSG